MRNRIIIASAALTCVVGAQAQFVYPDHPHAVYINLFHPAGAECTFQRDGAALDVQRIQSPVTRLGYEEDWIDISASHGDVTLTCKTADGWEESRTLRYGPYEVDNFLAGCGVAKQGPQPCPTTPWVSKSTAYGYLPGYIRMRRDDAVGGAP
jgi:hypothetical protein